MALMGSSDYVGQVDALEAPKDQIRLSSDSRVRSGPSIVLGVSSAVMMLAAIFNSIGKVKLDELWPYLIGFLNVGWLLIYLFCARRKFRSNYLFSSAFVLTLWIFHFSYVWLYVTGSQEVQFLTAGSMAGWYERASWYISLALGAFGLGISLSPGVKPEVGDEFEMKYAQDLAYWVGTGLLAGSVIAIVLLVISVGNIFAYSRAQIFAGVGDTRGLGFVLLVLPTSMILMVCSSNTSGRKSFSYVVAVLSFLVIMFLGERSAALFPCLVGLVAWRKMEKKVPFFLLATGILVVLVLIPLVRELRTVGPYSQVGVSDVEKSFQKTDVSEVFVELGAMHGLLANVLKWVPDADPYRYGSSYLRALSSAIPNLGFTRAGSGRTEVQGVLGSDDVARSLSPSDWYIYKVNRWMFNVGGGSGFSIVAEMYLNFGMLGVISGFILLGMLMGRLDSKQLLREPVWLVSASVLVWPLLKIVRNDFETLVKPVSLILITLFIWRGVGSLLGKPMPKIANYMSVIK